MGTALIIYKLSYFNFNAFGEFETEMTLEPKENHMRWNVWRRGRNETLSHLHHWISWETAFIINNSFRWQGISLRFYSSLDNNVLDFWFDLTTTQDNKEEKTGLSNLTLVLT